MISVLSWLFYSYMFNIQNVDSVKIFQNMLPNVMPTKYIPYVPEVTSKICLLKQEEGPCRGNIKMYYYEPEIANCTSFKWGGCQGNGNRFNTQEECRNKCLSKEGGPKNRPKWCGLTFDYGFCFGAVQRYYYDSLWKVCKKTIYSGCGGNRNNFYSYDQCESVCIYGNGFRTVTTDSNAPTKVLIINPDSDPSNRPRNAPRNQGGKKSGIFIRGEENNGRSTVNTNDDGKGQGARVGEGDNDFYGENEGNAKDNTGVNNYGRNDKANNDAKANEGNAAQGNEGNADKTNDINNINDKKEN